MRLQAVENPYSVCGSFLAWAYIVDSDRAGVGKRCEELTLRMLRSHKQPHDLIQLVPDTPARTPQSADFECGGSLTLPTGKQPIDVTFLSPTRIQITAGDDGFSLVKPSAVSSPDNVVRLGNDRWAWLVQASRVLLRLRLVKGDAKTESTWDGEENAQLALRFAPGSVVEIEEDIAYELPGNFDINTLPTFQQYLDGMPPVADRFSEARELSAYVNWSAIVGPSGFHLYPTMLMSKMWMIGSWSWDHCFNALALTGFPDLAYQQWKLLFDWANKDGFLPDYVTDREYQFCFAKPPVHGWTLRFLQQHGALGPKQIEEGLGLLESWTESWFKTRLYNNDKARIPFYWHGNDSGWDNATVFRAGVPLESPDLGAHMVLQLDSMTKMAVDIGDEARASRYSKRADEVYEILLKRHWKGDRFVAIVSETGEEVDTQSGILFQPLMLGSRLSEDMIESMIKRLIDGGFVTEWGLATESPSSPAYQSDGYWLGPVWAPETMLVVQGLYDAGRKDLARDIAEKFCAAFVKSGAAENFDALTGAANRDTSYTWTSSVFLVLASEYVRDGPKALDP